MSSHPPRRTFPKLCALAAVFILCAMGACHQRREARASAGSAPELAPVVLEPPSTPGSGEAVPELGKSILIIFQDANNNYWFGSDGHGVYRYDGTSITNFTTRDGLSGDRVREIKADKSGNVFVNTLDGVSKFDGQRFAALTPVESRDPDKGWKLQPDDLWFKGRPGERGPYRYDGSTLYYLKFPKHHMEDEFFASHPQRPRPPYSPYEVYDIYKDRRGHIWLGTSNFGICRFDGMSLSWMYEEHLTLIAGGGSFGIRSIFEDKDGAFWFCNTRYRYDVYPSDAEKDKGMINYRRRDGIKDLRAPDGKLVYFMSIVEDDNHHLWMATYGAGVYRYDGTNVTRYPVKDGGADTTVYSIYKDSRGDLWLGTHEAGAYKFNGGAFEKFRP